MNGSTDRARVAVADALVAVLVALVALDGVDDLEPPAEALDLALASSEPYRAARARFRPVHERLRGVVADDVFFEIEGAVHKMVVAALDAGFRVGRSLRE